MLKHNKKIKLINKGLVLLLCVLLTIAFTGCKKQTEQVETPTTQATENQTTQLIIENNSNEQLHSFIIPKSLMGKATAEEYVTEFNDETVTVPSVSGEEIPIKQAYTDNYANADGTVTFVFTTEQLEMRKLYWHSLISYLMTDVAYEGSFIKKVDVTEDHTNVIVYVNNIYENYDVSDAMAVAAGHWQIFNGVAPDKWHAKVTVKDYETGKVISEDSYPKE